MFSPELTKSVLSNKAFLVCFVPLSTLFGLGMYYQSYYFPMEQLSRALIWLQPRFIDLSLERSPFSNGSDDYEEYVNDSRVYILDWTTFFGTPMEKVLDWFKHCPNFNCEIISNKSRLNESDAVVYHIRNMDWSNIPKTRLTEQYYVFYLMESPHHSSVDSRAFAFFNLTMSYRTDSDFFTPYGDFRKISPSDDEQDWIMGNTSEIVENKTKLVAWFVSNCGTPSKREQYVDELKKYIQIDVFGACGKSHCPKTMSCNEMLKRQYKFYLSFENSLCKDYVTEKLFDRMNNYVVPVVLKKSMYHERLPAYSVISADDFGSVKELADYLKYLDHNSSAYMEYFQWRNSYEVKPTFSLCSEEHTCGFCALCAFLHRKNKPTVIKYDLRRWWHDQGACDTNFVAKILTSSAQSQKTV